MSNIMDAMNGGPLKFPQQEAGSAVHEKVRVQVTREHHTLPFEG